MVREAILAKNFLLEILLETREWNGLTCVGFAMMVPELSSHVPQETVRVRGGPSVSRHHVPVLD